jgi:hypothetical protein
MIRLLMAALCLSCSALWAQEQARVLSTTPSYIPTNTVNSNGEVLMSTVFNVVYEYAGKQYTVQLPHDPGAYVILQSPPQVLQRAIPSMSCRIRRLITMAIRCLLPLTSA